MALSENQSPNFTVIADFICGLANEITDVFTGVLLVASELELLGNTCFALDGCKIQCQPFEKRHIQGFAKQAAQGK